MSELNLMAIHPTVYSKPQMSEDHRNPIHPLRTTVDFSVWIMVGDQLTDNASMADNATIRETSEKK